jgi:TolB-like protein
VVVLGIKPIDESTRKTAESLTEILTTDLAKTGRFEVMAESDVGTLIGFERQKQILGCTDTGCLAEIAGAVGADYLLYGTMGKVGNQLSLDLKLADSKKASIAARDGAQVDSADQLIGAGRKVLQGILTQMGFVPVKPVVEVRAQTKGAGPVPYVVLGLGGAALVAGGVLTAVTIANKESYTYSVADTQVSAGIIVGGVGLAALVAGIVWAAVGSTGSTPVAVGLAPTPGGAALCAAGSF